MSPSSKDHFPLSPLQSRLFEGLKALRDEFPTLSRADLKVVTEHLLRREPQQSPLSHVPPFDVWVHNQSRYYLGDVSVGLILAIEPLSNIAFSTLHSDIETEKSLLVVLPEILELGAELKVCVMLKPVGLEIWYSGQVVHRTSQGTGLRLEALIDSHRALWTVARTSYEKSTTLAITPISGPKTAPPLRLQRSTTLRSTTSAAARSSHRVRSQPSQNTRPVRRHTPQQGHAPPSSSTRPFRKSRKQGSQPRPKPSSTGELIKHLRAKRAQVGRANPFEMLGLHWSAHKALVEKAYESEVNLLRIELFDEAIQQAVSADLDAVRQALDKAFAALHNDDQRRACREGITDARQREDAVEHYLDKGRDAQRGMDWATASGHYRRVLELDPSNAPGRAGLRACEKNDP